MPPPEEDIRVIEYLVAQSMFGHIQGGNRYFEGVILIQCRFHRTVNALGIYCLDALFLVMNVFVPNGYIDFFAAAAHMITSVSLLYIIQSLCGFEKSVFQYFLLMYD